MKLSRIVACIGISVVLGTTSVLAASTEEKATAYRLGAFRMIGWHLGPLGAMAKGNLDFDMATAKTNADAIATLADFPQNAFIDGSGSDAVETRAKPEIWSNRADFDSKMKDFVAAAKALPGSVDSLDNLKNAVGALGKTCKGCHKEYRHKKN